MNLINALVTRSFDLLLAPLERVGPELALLVVSGVFGVLALWAFKHISWQRGIKSTKNRIKGHLIEIRIYQDDLGLVTRAIGKVLARNFQYLGLNFGPFVPLAIPFAFVVAQMVVRYGFDPVELQPALAQTAELQREAGAGITLRITGERAAIEQLEIDLPEGLVPLSPLLRVPQHGRARQELAAVAPGQHQIVLRVGEREIVKELAAGHGARPRALQPTRVTGLATVLWPAEPSLSGTGLEVIEFDYPESELGWLPGSGPLGVILVFLVASMIVGFAALKPLGVQI